MGSPYLLTGLHPWLKLTIALICERMYWNYLDNWMSRPRLSRSKAFGIYGMQVIRCTHMSVATQPVLDLQKGQQLCKVITLTVDPHFFLRFCDTENPIQSKTFTVKNLFNERLIRIEMNRRFLYWHHRKGKWREDIVNRSLDGWGPNSNYHVQGSKCLLSSLCIQRKDIYYFKTNTSYPSKSYLTVCYRVMVVLANVEFL